MERIDKIISDAKNITRAQAKTLIRQGRVSVNGSAVKDAGLKVDEGAAEIICDGKRVEYSRFVYIMLNKSKGVISASDGRGEKTVVDLLPDEMKRKNLFPAGRLDKDTTGFVLITDDGDFAHRILSPKKHIPKTYVAKLDKPVDEDIIKAFETGVELGDETCLPATLKVTDEATNEVEVTIAQGMYHQIKRMFKKYGAEVLELERIKMGNLPIDPALEYGECRYLTKDELKMIEGQ